MTSPIAILTALVALTVPAFSQGGPLTPPPGAPAPTMKSLDQVEPRIPLVAGSPGGAIAALGTITISQPGSYYLTGNLQITGDANGIFITASGVSLDLMGYSIISPFFGNAATGVSIFSSNSNISIQNGHIISTTTFDGTSFTLGGFVNGITGSSSGSNNISISNITVRGTRGTGIWLNGQGVIVANCSIVTAAGAGIDAINSKVIDSVVHTTGGIGINAFVVSNCRVNNTISTGIDALNVSNSYAQSASFGSNGIRATTVENSVGITSGLHGISATTVSNSRGQSTSTASNRHGIIATGGQVSGSRGEAAGGHGISASSVSNSVGSSSGANGAGSSGISANRVSSSQGTASNAAGGHGIFGSYSVTASYGTSSGASGIRCFEGTVSDSYGTSNGSTVTSRGIEAQMVTNSRGISTHASGGEGVWANALAMNAMGSSAGRHGIYAQVAATNCFGTTTHTADTSHGISSIGTVTNSYGWSNGASSGDGINATVVTSSYGFAAAGARHGIWATRILESSYGFRATPVADRFGIRANRASLSEGVNGQNITHPYNMP